MTSRRHPILAMALLLILTGCGNGTAEEEENQPKELPLGFDTECYSCDSTCVKSGETFGVVMSRLGMSAKDSYSLAQVCDSVFNVARIIAGTPMEAYYSADSTSAKNLQYVVYHNSRIACTVFKCRDSLAVWKYTKPVTSEHKFADITIHSSLWNDMIAAGASPALIMELADIYQWSVNLFTLQKEDRFRVIYDQSVCDGEVISIDSVHVSVFNSGTVEVPAVRYCIDGKSMFWGKGGESLKRMFLKAPLRYNRISSGFTYRRKHPITGKVRAHTAVDYAAPKGTPVHAIGNGTVTLCGWDGSGGGNRIRIKHPQGYESCYMHLSGFAKGIKSGAMVTQGQLIGYVGSTGRSTGPHLDFRIWQNGKPLNPLTLNSPASEPLAKKYMEEFNAKYDRLMAEVDSLSRK